MTPIVLMALMMVVAKLWWRVTALQQRIDTFEAQVSATPVPSSYDADPIVDAFEHEPAPVPEADPPSALSHLAENEPLEPESAGFEPAPAADSALPTSRKPMFSFGFEDLFGRLLPIWAGGVTLAVAGFLIVKFSIDRGLLSPLVRFISGLLFGTALIAAAEVALRAEAQVRDPRVRQALSGAGIATLYAAVLVGANLYHLIGPAVAFVGMALITALAGALSVRFGAPSALLGLVGGLAAPALVGSETPDVPVLIGYLSLAVGGLCTLSRTQRWMWLGAGALAGGFGWGAVLLINGSLDAGASISLGLFMLLLGVALPVLAFGGARGSALRMAASLGACAEVASLVASGGFLPLDWALFGMISIAIVWLSTRESALRNLSAIGLSVALLLIAVWPNPTAPMLTMVLVAFGLIFGGSAAWRVWRQGGSLSDAGQVSAIAVAAFVLPDLHLNLLDRQSAALALLGAAISALVAALGWNCATRQNDARFATLTASAAALLAAAGVTVAPHWLAAPWLGFVAALTLLLSRRANDLRIEKTAWMFALATLVGLAIAPHNELLHAFGKASGEPAVRPALRWALPAFAAVLFATRSRHPLAPWLAQPVGVALAVVASAQLVSTHYGSIVPALLLAVLALGRRSMPAAITAGIISIAWSAEPLARWATTAIAAVGGLPAYVTGMPDVKQTALRLVVPGLAFASAAMRKADTRIRRALIAVAVLLGVAAAHIFYKQLFAIADPAQFVHLGLAERTVLETVLTLAALAVWRPFPTMAKALGIASLAHLLWFSILLHNPLWSQQNVGAWPVLNLLLPLYGLGFGLLWLAGREPLPPPVERARAALQMLLVLLFAASELRQLVHGSNLVAGVVGQGEDIARSVLLIALAIGFLRFGIARLSRDWRIASLLLMIAAVGKVFLLDAAGLDGLLRIAAFAALGFSLIGIGWLYQRTLPESSLTKNQRLAARPNEGEV